MSHANLWNSFIDLSCFQGSDPVKKMICTKRRGSSEGMDEPCLDGPSSAKLTFWRVQSCSRTENNDVARAVLTIVLLIQFPHV